MREVVDWNLNNTFWTTSVCSSVSRKKITYYWLLLNEADKKPHQNCSSSIEHVNSFIEHVNSFQFITGEAI